MTAVARDHVQPAERTGARAPTRSQRPRLRVLDQAAARRRARRRLAAIALTVAAVAGLFAIALAHAQLVANQHQLDEMRSRMDELEAEKAQIERAVDEASSPAVVVDRAEELGMVRASEPVYLAVVRGTGSG